MPPLFNSDGLTLLHATSARAWFRRQRRPATAAAGLSRLGIFSGLFYVNFWLLPFILAGHLRQAAGSLLFQ